MSISRNKFSRKTKAFSLVELLVAMAIIAVLLGLVGFGIATAQRSSRDSQRQQRVSDIRVALTDFQTRKNKYPSEAIAADIKFNNDSIVLDGNSSQPITIELSGPTLAGTSTGPNSSWYCYRQLTTEGGYLLGVKLENGQWFDQSQTLDNSQSCSDTNGNITP